MQKFKRTKMGLYFGNFIDMGDLELVYWAIKQKSIDDFYKLIKQNDNYEISRINKRAIIAIQLFFKYNYFPIFPEIFALANNFAESKQPSKIHKGETFSVMESILKLPEQLELNPDFSFNWSKRRFNAPHSEVFLKNTSVLESFLASAADLIINFMETNSSSVEAGLYLDKENFKKTIIITPPQVLVERVVVGEFTKYVINELRPENANPHLYKRLSLFTELSSFRSSENTKGFYTYLNPYELPPLLDKYLKRRVSDFSLRSNYKFSSQSNHFYRLINEIEKNPVNALTSLKLSKYTSISRDEAAMLYLKYKISFDKLFSRNETKNANEKVDVIRLISAMFFMITKQNPKEFKSQEYYEIRKKNGGTRRVYPQPEETKDAYRAAADKLYLSNPDIENEVSHAYLRGRGVYWGLSKHIGNNHFLKFDISDFFGSLNKKKVLSITNDLSIDNSFHAEGNKGVKQGYIISPIISNIYMLEFDNAIWEYSKTNNYVITRYADDILVSGIDLSEVQIGEIKKFVSDQLDRLKLKLNPLKTKIQKNSINFLGLTISQKGVKVSRRKTKYIARLKRNRASLSAREWGIYNYYSSINKLENLRKQNLGGDSDENSKS